MSKDPVVIASVARTPIGSFQGELSSCTAPQLGAVAVKAAIQRAGISADTVQELILGCVLPAGLGQAPARQAAITAGLPLSVGCTTVNKVCGSGMKAAMLGHDLLMANSNEVIVAGGMESMTNAPYFIPKARGGFRLGHGQILDHMSFDGLEDAYFHKGRAMGTFAEECAESYGFSREDQDAYAIESTTRAQAAIRSGAFAWEVAPVMTSSRKGEVLVEQDEQPSRAKLDKIKSLKPAFKTGGTVTAANSSSISDGAAALVLMRRSSADRLGIKPLAAIVGHAAHAQEPRLFTTAPAAAMEKLLSRIGWATSSVDLWEINEAFAVAVMAAMRDMALDHGKVNIHGGACAIGHPIGASGARILVSLLAALRLTGGSRGVASLCIGGGEATAMAIEMI
ncbi:acetyl-CoA C-acetyltransferase [Burkholderia sp. GAS332]|uniref:acetyl-CoA C-acyltransferase n=1 Tax=Paraburkholderia sediminicola TaxID=458836 RepID=UPI00092C048D|nr:acetyl-CoA C-acetyltransferase [Burkholderia sp. GAS332]